MKLFRNNETDFLLNQVVHVFQWQPVRRIKEELLHNCPVWVKLLDLPSFLWPNIKDLGSSLGKVLYAPSLDSPNRKKLCLLWNIAQKLTSIMQIYIPNIDKL